MDDRPLVHAAARLTLTFPEWVVLELERLALERPGQSLDAFVSDLVRQWAGRRRAARLSPVSRLRAPAR